MDRPRPGGRPRRAGMIGGLVFPFFEKPGGSLPSPAEPPIVTLAAMGGRSRGRKAGFPFHSRWWARSCFWFPPPEARHRATTDLCRPSPAGDDHGGLAGSFPPGFPPRRAEGVGLKPPRTVWRKHPPEMGFRRGRGGTGPPGVPLACLVRRWWNWWEILAKSGFPVEP